jgi:YD repeat-containing protein
LFPDGSETGGSEPDRVTEFYYDWRNRQVASKGGVEASESTSLNRPIFYQELDNLGQVTASEQYDGDNVSIVDANSDGVPDKPSSSLLRARGTSEYDEQGRVFASHVFSVDPSTGSVSTDSLTTDTFYDHRGQVIKTESPGGLVQKQQYDGAGRVVKSFTSDGGGDSGWSDADDVTGDKVLEQTETTYDANGNPILVTTRQRFHD